MTTLPVELTATPSVEAEAHPIASEGGCTNCQSANVALYCADCGEKQPGHHDLTLGHFAHDVVHELLHVDGKLVRTVKMLALRPGLLSQEYFGGQKSRSIGPLRLFIVLFAIQWLVYSFSPRTAIFDIDTIQKANPEVGTSLAKVAKLRKISVEQVKASMNAKWGKAFKLLELLQIVFAGAFISILYRRRHFVEHVVFSTHFLAATSLYGLLMYPIRYQTGVIGTTAATTVSWISAIAFTAYMAFAMKRFYEGGRKLPWVRAIFGYGFIILAIATVQTSAVVYAMATAGK